VRTANLTGMEQAYPPEPPAQPPQPPGPGGLYPVQYSVDYPDRPLNRLTTFFRLIVVIPIAIVLSLVEGALRVWISRATSRSVGRRGVDRGQDGNLVVAC
jgi:hypothetical protein